jgi:hypothetical protein
MQKRSLAEWAAHLYVGVNKNDSTVVAGEVVDWCAEIEDASNWRFS